MGNMGSTDSGRRRRRRHPPAPQPPPPQPPQPEIPGNRYVFAADPQFQGYYPPPPPVAGPYGQPYGNWVGGQYPSGAVPPPVTLFDHQKAVTIGNDVDIKKESLRLEPDETDAGKYLVSFTFDAAAPGSITVMFLAKETEDCNLIATREDLFKPTTISFQQGLGQKFRQPPGTGVESSAFEDTCLRRDDDVDVYPLVVKAEACPASSVDADGNQTRNSQITQAVIEKEKGEFKAGVVKQILWVNRMRYELLEIYGIVNAVEGDYDGNDSGKECFICLSELRDTVVLPCRHMCMCSECAKVLSYQTNRCPICRQRMEQLLVLKGNNATDESGQSARNAS